MTAPAAPAAPGTSAAPASDNPIAAAGEAFLASLTEEQRNTPIGDPDEDEGAAPVPAAAEAATDVGEPITRDDGAEFNEAAGRWQLNGKFVAGETPEGWTAPAKAATETDAATATGTTPEGGEPPATDAAVKVTLPGLAERGEEDIEVEVDKDLADRIARLKNDGIRAADYRTKVAALTQREAALEAYQQELDVDPIGFHLNRMPKEQQIAVAQALIVEHFDELANDIEALKDPKVRLDATRQVRDGLKASSDKLTHDRQVRAAVREVVTAVEALVPEGTDEATAREFIADARRDLAAASQAGERISPQNAKQYLARRLSLYGFDKPKAPAAPAKPAIPSALPVSDRAKEIAARRPVTADAAAAQARIRRVQAARAAGARVAPVGAGAAPVQMPAVPPEAEADIESMSRYLRKSGNLPNSWRGVGRE